MPVEPPAPLGTSRRYVAILALAIVVSAVVGGIGGYLLGLDRAISSRPIYRAAISVRTSDTTNSYQGQAPSRSVWLVVNLTLVNPGDVALGPGFRDWEVLDSGGLVLATPEAAFYSSRAVPANTSTGFVLVFDTYTSPAPTAIRLTLPDGGETAGALPIGAPRVIGVLPGRSQDGTNWTLTFTSVPSGLTTSGTTLTIFSPGGSTALAATAFSLLDYATHHAAYVQAYSGSSVGVGDRLLISTTTYPNGYTYQLSDGTTILASGTLQG